MIYNKSRYNYGVSTIIHKGKPVTTSLGSSMDDFITKLDSSFSFEVGSVPVEHEYRPDLTSYIFYDTVTLWWMLLQYNNIEDPFEGFGAGEVIKIPNI
jgi:hypothetical protein